MPILCLLTAPVISRLSFRYNGFNFAFLSKDIHTYIRFMAHKVKIHGAPREGEVFVSLFSPSMTRRF